MHSRGVLIVLLLLLVTAIPVLGEVATFSYQGYLTTSGGSPVTDGTHQVQLKLYSTPTGGSPIITTTPQMVTTRGGAFSAEISFDPEPLFNTEIEPDSIYMEILVGDPLAAMSPRNRYIPAFYAAHAGDADAARDLILPSYMEASDSRTLITLRNGGTGPVMDLSIENQSSSATVLRVISQGTGYAGEFRNTNPSNNSATLIVSSESAAPAIEVSSSGSGPAIRATSSGVGPVCDFTGTVQMSGFRLPTGKHAGYVLTCDDNGNGYWLPIPTGAPSTSISVQSAQSMEKLLKQQQEIIKKLEKRIVVLEKAVKLKK